MSNTVTAFVAAPMRVRPKHVFISVDIEANGKSPLTNSMIGIGAVAFNQDGGEVGEIDIKLAPIPGHVEDEDTVENFFKKKNPAAWAHLQTDVVSAKDGIDMLAAWILKMRREHGINPQAEASDDGNGDYTLIAWPSAFDMTWLETYWSHFRNGDHLNWFQCVDIRSYAMAQLDMDMYKQTSASNAAVNQYKPRQGDGKHFAVDDARCQGQFFFNLRARRPCN